MRCILKTGLARAALWPGLLILALGFGIFSAGGAASAAITALKDDPKAQARLHEKQARLDELQGVLDLLKTAPAIGERSGEGGQKRLALVIGNNAYSDLDKLDKAVGDAQTIANALTGLGFAVTALENIGVDDFDAALASFYATIDDGDIAFFFFAGHGIAAGGVNYLLPVDMPEIRASEVRRVERNAIDASRIVSEISSRGAELAFVVLDACRDDPFPRPDTRGAVKAGGLARMSPDPGTFIIYSAGTGQTALDRLSPQDENPNSIFTRKFWPILTTPGMPIVEIAKRTQVEVKSLADEVKHEQAPAYYDQVIGQFYFRPPEPKLYGLVIGIDEYNRERKLRGAVNDARWISAALRDAGASDVIEITDRDARPQFIAFAWQRLIEQARPGDTVIFAYAGASSQISAPDAIEEADGLNEYLALADLDFGSLHEPSFVPDDGAVLYDDVITEWMKLASAKNVNVVLVVDGCYGGGLLDREFANISFVGASAEDEVVFEYTIRDEPHGLVSALFTGAIDGAADINADGYVSQKELFGYLQYETSNYLLSEPHRQTPQFLPKLSEASSDLALFRVSNKRAASGETR